MDRQELVLIGIPLFFFFCDLVHLFTPPASPPANHHHHQRHNSGELSAAIKTPQVEGIGYGTAVELKFCASCSYRGNALTMKKMLENSFPGVEVILSNYPLPLPKRLLDKLVPLVQVGFIALVMAGEQIFPRLGFVVLPPWYFRLRANRFGAMATTWLLGNYAHSFLQKTGAFEVYCNGDLVFSKLMEQRFPSELELQDLIRRRLAASTPVV